MQPYNSRKFLFFFYFIHDLNLESPRKRGFKTYEFLAEYVFVRIAFYMNPLKCNK